MELDGAVAIVTGGGSGIGRATALLLARQKANVVVCGRRPARLEETIKVLQATGGRGIALTTDVRDESGVKAMVDAVIARFGRVDVLVNNAGVAVAKPMSETTEEEWNQVIDTNLKGAFLCSKAVLPSMTVAGRGVIVNISSILGRSGLANFSAYCASKFGVIGFSEAMADEYRATGIRVYAVCPGRTSTEMQRQLGGETIARLSMDPAYVAERIVGLVMEPSAGRG
jgi:3-oxoacyl-[acyl-carrier protein] reductase